MTTCKEEVQIEEPYDIQIVNSEETIENQEDDEENQTSDKEDDSMHFLDIPVRPVPTIFDPEIVNQALAASKKKTVTVKEKKECKICGFTASSGKGLTLHISHLHK